MSASNRVPKLCHHKGSDKAVVRLNGKDFYLGQYGTKEAAAEYEKLIARWLAHGRTLPDPDEGVTVNEVILGYIRYAKSRYAPRDGQRDSNEVGCIRDALKIVKALYGRSPAAKFGPKALSIVRGEMIKLNWSRSYVNHQVDRVRRMIRWAVAEELVPGEARHALSALPGLRRGTPGVRETEPIKPVANAFVEAAMPFMPSPAAAMVRLQLLTGCRPGEVCAMRAADIDMGGRVWVYRPVTHKTAHHGHDHSIYIGPRAQEVLGPWLVLDTTAYLFSPARAEAQRNAQRRVGRKTPMTPSQANRRPKRNRARSPRDRYDVAAYRRAIRRACDKADIAARKAALDQGEMVDEKTRLVPRWHPHQLRHNAATNLRREFGVEVARIILGHRTAFTTEIYAEVDRKQAADIMAKVG